MVSKIASVNGPVRADDIGSGTMYAAGWRKAYSTGGLRTFAGVQAVDRDAEEQAVHAALSSTSGEFEKMFAGEEVGWEELMLTYPSQALINGSPGCVRQLLPASPREVSPECRRRICRSMQVSTSRMQCTATWTPREATRSGPTSSARAAGARWRRTRAGFFSSPNMGSV